MLKIKKFTDLEDRAIIKEIVYAKTEEYHQRKKLFQPFEQSKGKRLMHNHTPIVPRPVQTVRP